MTKSFFTLVPRDSISASVLLDATASRGASFSPVSTVVGGVYALPSSSAISRSSAARRLRISHARPELRSGSFNHSSSRASSARFRFSCTSSFFSNAPQRSAFSRFQLGHFVLNQCRLGPLAYRDQARLLTTPSNL